MIATHPFVHHFRTNWRIRGAHNGVAIVQPSSVFRYMHEEHVDQFFREGLLKLSTFESNRSIEDSVRRDESEGAGEYLILGRDRSLRLMLGARAFDQRMLCLSSSSDIGRMMDHFKVDGCFEVTNTLGFGFEIAQALDVFKFGLEGLVTYQDNHRRHLLLEQHQQLPDLLVADPPNEQLFPYIDFIGRNDFDMLFTKPLQFQHEQEYRFTWRCAPNHPILIHCPGALKYCRKVI